MHSYGENNHEWTFFFSQFLMPSSLISIITLVVPDFILTKHLIDLEKHNMEPKVFC